MHKQFFRLVIWCFRANLIHKFNCACCLITCVKKIKKIYKIEKYKIESVILCNVHKWHDGFVGTYKHKKYSVFYENIFCEENTKCCSG